MIQQALTLSNISQTELAAKLGIPLTTLNGYIKDKYKPSYHRLEDIAAALDVSVEYLLGKSAENILSDDELTLIARYRKLDDKKKNMALDYFKYLESQQDKSG